MKNNTLTFDASISAREKDENGFLRVNACHITKETVNPYYGREIPDWEINHLDPNAIYYGYRAGDEIAKAARTFDGLPLLMGHHIESADDPQKEYRVGSIGTDTQWEAPYLNSSLFITDSTAIKAVEDGKAKEISCAYMYDPDFTRGEFEGVSYDFVMRNIRGNHVALVPEGRAGSDVVVADEQIKPTTNNEAETMTQEEIEQKEVEHAQAILDLHKNVGGKPMDNDDEQAQDGDNDAMATLVEKLQLTPEQEKALVSLLDSLAVGKDAEPEAEEDKPVEDADEDEEEKEPLTPDEAIKLADEEDKQVEEVEDEDLDTPEAVNAGEKNERDNRMREYMKAAADKCGLDAESEEFQKAFAEGVKYGEKQPKTACDARTVAMDAKAIKDATMRHFRALNKAAEATRSVIGNVDAFAFDSADDIYGVALKKVGINPSKYSKSAWRGMFEAYRAASSPVKPAMDSAPEKGWEGPFAGLNRIKHY